MASAWNFQRKRNGADEYGKERRTGEWADFLNLFGQRKDGRLPTSAPNSGSS